MSNVILLCRDTPSIKVSFVGSFYININVSNTIIYKDEIYGLGCNYTEERNGEIKNQKNFTC